MYLTGFADEAATDIDGQIRATKELGWEYIEARNIDGVNLSSKLGGIQRKPAGAAAHVDDDLPRPHIKPVEHRVMLSGRISA
jgi:hypothetical protein